MKEATGELNITIIVVIAIAAISIFFFPFLTRILDDIADNWETGQEAGENL